MASFALEGRKVARNVTNVTGDATSRCDIPGSDGANIDAACLDLALLPHLRAFRNNQTEG